VTTWRVDRASVVGFRLANQHVAARLDPGDLAQAAGVAPQNTPPGSALLGLRARADVSAAGVRDAQDPARTLVQAWCLRGSPCLVAADELPIFTVGLLPDDDEAWRAVMQGFLPIIDGLRRTATEVAGLVTTATKDALDGAVLTKRELGTALRARLPGDFAPWFDADTFSEFSAIVVRAISLTGKVVITPRTSSEASFTRTGQWLGRELDDIDGAKRTALRAALVRRYLHLHGPSTSDDLAVWAGVSPSFASRSWKAVEAELVPVDLDGRTGWILAADREALREAVPPTGIRLLPPYDPYLQQRDRSTGVPDTTLHNRIWRSAGNPGIVLRHGEVVGMWRHKKQGARLLVTVEAVQPLSAADRDAIAAEAEPLAAFRGCTSTQVTFDPGPGGPS
jgi:hypothetical protein